MSPDLHAIWLTMALSRSALKLSGAVASATKGWRGGQAAVTVVSSGSLATKQSPRHFDWSGVLMGGCGLAVALSGCTYPAFLVELSFKGKLVRIPQMPKLIPCQSLCGRPTVPW